MENKKSQIPLIVSAIVIAGILIAGAILLRGKNQGNNPSPDGPAGKQTAVEFNKCLDSGKYIQAVKDSTAEASKAGVSSTPFSFILKDGKVVATISGAQPFSAVAAQIDNALAGKLKTISNYAPSPISVGDHLLGNPKATVTIIEYSDYQCPFCGKFYRDTLQAVKTNYIQTGKISFVYRDFDFLGPESFRASEATWCAKEQGKYWEYQGYLFNHQNGENGGAFSDENLKLFAAELGLK
jgi:protein-disulfide isomerase